VNRCSKIWMLVILAFAGRAWAQVQAGNVTMNLNGTLSAGYSADYANYTASDHSNSLSGTGDFSGFYYAPTFLSFDVKPFYDQSRANSDFQSVTGARGMSASSNIFSGSSFPGSIVYSRTDNSSGNYSIPGSSDYTTHGNSDTFGIRWSERLDGLPSVGVGFTDSNSNSSVFGDSDRSTLNSKTFTATSAYSLAGFHMAGGYRHNDMASDIRDLLIGDGAEKSNTTGSSYFFSVTHALPLTGSFNASMNKDDIDTKSAGVDYSTNTKEVGAGVDFNPVRTITVGSNISYIDNLAGSLYTSLIAAGVLQPQALTQLTSTSSDSLNVNSYLVYDATKHLHFRVFDSREHQDFQGSEIASNTATATVTYVGVLWGGEFNQTLGVTHNSIDTSDQSTTGLNVTTNYTRNVHNWKLAGSFNYSQDSQTAIASYTSSGYNFTGNIGRKLARKTYLSASVAGARSLLTNQPGSSNSSQSYSSTLSLARISFTGSYSKSDGNALLTSAGLVATSVPLPVLNESSVVVYNGHAYSAAIGSNPFHGMSITASYSKAWSSTASTATYTNNYNKTLNLFVQYNVRKINLTAGYLKLDQGFSASGQLPTMLGSYYFGLSRWFSFF